MPVNFKGSYYNIMFNDVLKRIYDVVVIISRVLFPNFLGVSEKLNKECMSGI